MLRMTKVVSGLLLRHTKGDMLMMLGLTMLHGLIICWLMLLHGFLMLHGLIDCWLMMLHGFLILDA